MLLILAISGFLTVSSMIFLISSIVLKSAICVRPSIFPVALAFKSSRFRANRVQPSSKKAGSIDLPRKASPNFFLSFFLPSGSEAGRPSLDQSLGYCEDLQRWCALKNEKFLPTHLMRDALYCRLLRVPMIPTVLSVKPSSFPSESPRVFIVPTTGVTNDA